MMYNVYRNKREGIYKMIKRTLNDGSVMFYDKALREMPSAQCGVMVRSNGDIEFYSYRTHVITLTTDGWLSCFGLYSMTTRKQIGRFLKEYAPLLTYQMVKKVYEDNYSINAYTGEIR